MIAPYFSLRRSKRTFRLVSRHYKRRVKTLDHETKEAIEGYLHALRAALLKKDAEEAKRVARELEGAALRLIPKSALEKARDFIGGILFALAIAVLIRTMWFELYTIPSGSMRPTLKEEDYLVVSKTDYGINVPLRVSHFYFDPDLVQRGSIIVFNGANMDIADADTVYFYLFPGKKQFVKRLIGKPGDTIYFYGGKLYGIDKEGREIAEFRDAPSFDGLEHIPFIRFEGKVQVPKAGSLVFHQMNLPVAKFTATPFGKVVGEMIAEQGRPAPSQYGDLWGMKHFAMSRLLTQSDLDRLYPNAKLEKGLLYLELTHHPTLQGSELALNKSLIPLQERHLKAISQHMTTCRFSVKNGVALRLGWSGKDLASYLPKLPGVPDGTYEIQDGKAYKLPFPRIPIVGIFTNGITKELPLDHALYAQDPETIYKLYNLGIEFLTECLPQSKWQRIVPSRYAYFRGGELYLLGAPLLQKGDEALQAFVESEKGRPAPFIDMGPPSLEEIRLNGLKIPEKMYLALGDNHAMSADSREFGFVPEDNLKGGVSLLFSPPGPRWGRAPQPPQPHATFPNMAVWIAFMLAAAISSQILQRKLKKPLQF